MTTQTKHDGLVTSALNAARVAEEEREIARLTIHALTEEKERLQGYVSDWREECVQLRAALEELHAASAPWREDGERLFKARVNAAGLLVTSNKQEKRND